MKYHLEIMEIFYKFRNLHFVKILPHDLTHNECFAIMTLRKIEKTGSKKNTISTLARKLDVSVPSLSRTIKHLEEKGYIIRSEDTKDKRNIFLEITDSGNDVIDKAQKKMEKYFQSVYTKLGENRFNNFVNCLNDLYNISLEEIEKMKGSEEYK